MANYHLDNKDSDTANTLYYNDSYIIHITNPTEQNITSIAKKQLSRHKI